MSPVPVPYPIGGSATSIVTDPFTDWQSDPDWVVAGDSAALIAAWVGATAMQFEDVNFAYWDNNPEAPQTPSPRSTTATKTYTGLPALTFVSVAVDVSWYHGSGNVGLIGMRVNDAPFAPSFAPSGGFVPNTGAMIGYGTTDASGELTVAFVIEDIAPTFSINIVFSELSIYEGFYDPAPFADIIIDSAVLYHTENIPISITRGGASFAPNEEWEEMPFPGKTAPVYGGDQVVSMRPALRTTFMLTGERQISIYRPGGAWADSSYGRTYTPGEMRATLAAGFYLSGVRAIWKRARGDYIQVRFPKALCRSYGIEGQDLNEGGIAVEIEARQDLTTGTPGTIRPYYLDLLPFGATV